MPKRTPGKLWEELKRTCIEIVEVSKEQEDTFDEETIKKLLVTGVAKYKQQDPRGLKDSNEDRLDRENPKTHYSQSHKKPKMERKYWKEQDFKKEHTQKERLKYW